MTVPAHSSRQPCRHGLQPCWPTVRRCQAHRIALGTILVLLLSGLCSSRAEAQRALLLTRSETALRALHAADAGAAPGSEPIVLTLYLANSRSQTADLDQLLADQVDVTSPLYHHWLTPGEFGQRFGASDAATAQISAFFSSMGLTVGSVSKTPTRLTVTGSIAQAQSAFATSLHRFVVANGLYLANATPPAMPYALASLVDSVSGLDNLPTAGMARVRLITNADPAAQPIAGRVRSSGATGEPGSGTPVMEPKNALEALAAAIDNNSSAVLTLESSACVADLSPAEIAEFHSLLRQASAQGITVLATSGCRDGDEGSATPKPVSQAFPAAFSEVTAEVVTPVASRAAAGDGVARRPAWQAAAGLPVDALRHEPDLTTISIGALAAAISSLNREIGGRVGNVTPTLYALAKAPGLFTQPRGDSASAKAQSGAGSWQPATGLGTVDLATLLRIFPRATVNSTKVGIESSSYALGYGDTFTLIAKVLPNSYATAGPTGTITFTASSQGTIGSAAIDGSGTATLTPDVLPAGTYVLSATYSGDGSYSGSASNKTTITISAVNAKLTASLAPSTNLPYGSTATVTATVALPGANAAPIGPVSARINGVIGSQTSATLSPNPGNNTATANIVLSAPSPGSYGVEVTCQGTTNYQCQTPVNIPLTTVKGYTNATVAVTPAAPQAGQPISLTATVANAGNGSGTYTYNGSVTFYDAGKRLATAPVATNQATTTLTLSGNRTHNITAVYTGDANWNTSTSGAVAVTPTILPDSLTLSSNVSGLSSLAGVNIIFTATTTTTITYGIGPTGTITFYDTFNGAVVQLGSPATLVANGPTASIGLFTTTGLLPGTHRIYAQYSGDDSYAPAISAVNVLGLSDFSVSMTPVTLLLAQGKGAQVTVFVGGSGGFSGTVSLGCTPPSSSAATCDFAPASVTGGGATTLTITTAAPRSPAAIAALLPAVILPAGRARTKSLLSIAGGSLSIAALILVWLPGRRRRALPTLLAIMFAAVMLPLSVGCGLGVSGTNSSGSDAGGGGFGGPPVDSGTPLGTQNFVITAAGTDGTNVIRHTYQYQVTVQ